MTNRQDPELGTCRNDDLCQHHLHSVYIPRTTACTIEVTTAHLCHLKLTISPRHCRAIKFWVPDCQYKLWSH